MLWLAGLIWPTRRTQGAVSLLGTGQNSVARLNQSCLSPVERDQPPRPPLMTIQTNLRGEPISLRWLNVESCRRGASQLPGGRPARVSTLDNAPGRARCTQTIFSTVTPSAESMCTPISRSVNQHVRAYQRAARRAAKSTQALVPKPPLILQD